MEGLFLKFLKTQVLNTVELSDGTNSVTVGDWTYVRSGASLLTFKKNSGGKFTFEKKYDNVFGTPEYYQLFPWTVCHLKSSKKLLIVRDEEGMYVIELLDNKIGEKKRIGMNQVVNERIDEDSSEHSVEFFQLLNSDGILVKIVELGIDQMYKINLAPDKKELEEIGSPDEKFIVLASGSSEYQFFCIENGKFLGYTMENNMNEKKTIVADVIKEKVPLNVSIVYVANLVSSKAYLFANEFGLHIYKLDGKTLKFVCLNQEFSNAKGWNNDNWKTVKMIESGNNSYLVFTGPKGVGILKIAESCENFKIIDAEFPPDQTHGTVLAVIPSTDGGLELLVLNGNSIDSITVSIQKSNLSVATPKTPIAAPNYSTMIKFDSNLKLANQPPMKPSLWLGETLDTSSIVDGVDRTTGQLSFTLPIIDLRSKFGVPIRHTFYFNQPEEGTGVDPGVLGMYWSRSMDFIYVDRKDTVFEDEFEYFLVSDGTKVKLEWVESEGGKEVFKFEDTVVKYHKDGASGSWEVVTKDLVCWYGESENSIRWTLGWPNWNGKGTDEGSVLRRPLEWHLNSAKSAVGDSVVQYGYESKLVQTKDKVSYTKDIVLKTIEDKSEGISINFSYKTIKKSDENPITKDQSKYKVVFEDIHLLTGINIETSNYVQNITISYKNEQLIDKISDRTRDIISFEYKNMKVSTVKLPSGETITYTYNDITMNMASLTQRFEDSSILFTGPSYTIVSHVSNNKTINMQLLDINASEDMAKKQTLSVTIAEGISSLNILAQQNYFIVNVKIKNKNTLVTFLKNENSNQWVQQETQNHEQLVNIVTREKYWIVLSKTGTDFLKLTFLELEDNKNNFKTHQTTLKTKLKSGITFVHRGVAYFCESGVYLLRYDNKFLNYQISGKDFTARTKSILNQFEIQSYPGEEPDKFNNYKRDIENSLLDGLIMLNNLIIVREVTFADHKLSVILSTFVLDTKYNANPVNSVTIDGVVDLKIWKLNLSLKRENYDHECLLKFENNKGKCRLTLDQHKTKDPNAEVFKKYLLGFLKLPLDFEQFKLFQSGDEVICASNKLYFDGTNLGIKKIPEHETKIQKLDLQISKNVWIQKESENSNVKMIVKKGTENLQTRLLDVRRLDHMTIKPPFYVAFKANDKHSLVKIEKSGTSLSEVLRIQGNILKFSTDRLLVTSHDKKVLITPIRAVDFNNNFKVNVITSEQRGNSKTSYIFDPTSPVVTGRNVAFKKIKIVPNGDLSYGSFEQVTNFFDRSRKVNVLDSKNQIVVEDYKGSPDERDEPGTVNGTFVLYDKYGKNVISDLRPYTIDSQQVDFIGFERYENLKKPHWNIDETKIIRNQFAGTGNSFYKLDSRDLQGSYTLKNFQQTHIISSWIRIGKGLAINSETDILTVLVGGKLLKANVRDQINEWFLIEVMINPDDAKPNQQIRMTFKKSSYTFVDIDHIRLTPLDFSFRAIIFDEFRNNPIAVLRHNGRTVQYLYDDYGRKIGEVDEQGIVTKMVIYSKQPARNDVSSIVNLQPVTGFVESMSPYTAGLIWDFGNSWRFSPKRASIDSGKGTMKFRQSLENCSNISVRLVINRSPSGTLKIKFSKDDTGVDVSNLISITNGEVVIVRYKKFFSVWVDGHLKKQVSSQWNQPKELSIEVSGKVELSDIVVTQDVDLMIEYNNAKGQPIQQISVEDDEHLTMRGFMYDAVQRESVETVWTRHKINELGGKVLDFKSDYVKYDQLTKIVSGSIITDTQNSYKRFPFTMISYVDCPLTIRQKVGLPGEENSINSKRAVTYTRSTRNNFLQLLFPSKNGFRYEEQHLPNGANNTQVYDNQDRKVAEYVSVPEYNNILTTYLYNEAGDVIEVLRPNFHESVNTKAKAERFEDFLKKLDTSGQVTRTKQREFKEYNSFKQLTLKVTPDAGMYRFLYDHFRQLRFAVHYKNENEIDKVFFHKYNPSGEMFEFGVLNNEKNLEQLKSYANDVTYPIPETNYIRFDYGDTDTYSTYRSRKQSALKVDKFGSITETLYFNEDGNVLMRSYGDPMNSTRTIDVAFSYERSNVKEIIYPVKYQGANLVVSYTHNFKGQVIAVGTRSKPQQFAMIKHSPQGKVEELNFLPKDTNKFSVGFTYNAAGNMVSIDSSFMKENLDYAVGKGYNVNNAGDGSILRTTFEAKWHDKCNKKLIRIKIDDLLKSGLNFIKAKDCMEQLKKAKYIDENAKPIKSLREETRGDTCFSGPTFKKLSSILVGKGFPNKFGHAYDYGSHGEMTIAKYFMGNEDPSVNIQNKQMTMIADAGPGDVESFNIDPNGNHKLFYTENVRHELTYKQHTNQIESVKVGANQFSRFEHNSEGNVIKAEYKNIMSLEYDHLVDRVSKITMKDGTTIDLGYDIRGERTFKKVTTSLGKVTEKYYIRDIKARCLMDMRLVYQDGSIEKPLITLTTYIYGPLGLLGFIRNNVFYSVILDHEGSIRLVVKNGQVVAAYDYLPYGGRLRFFNSDPDSHVAYQYTGQEFDEETGLYNYHARLYDPELGRFYQTDPQEEFPSPYKYAGNSPVMNTDPDGELALLLFCILTALVGAYLSAASLSNSWNPAKWNWGSGHLWLALIGGAFAGAMLPVGGAASFATFASIGGAAFATAATASLALAGAYLGMAGAANDFNPANWDFTSPALYSGMLNGASLAVNIPSGVVGVSRTMATFTTAKTMYGAAIVGGSLLFGYGSAVFANNMTWSPAKWDWNARTVFALFEGGTTILMATSAFVKRGPQKALLPKKPASVSTAPTKRWVKKFKHSECRFDAYNDGIGDELGKLRYQQVMTGVKGKMGPVKPPPGMTKEFIAGLPTVKTLGATAVVSAVMLSEDLSKFKVYFSKAGSNNTNATNVEISKRQRVKRFTIGSEFSDAASGGSSLFDNVKRFFQFRSSLFTSNKSSIGESTTDLMEHIKRPNLKSIKFHFLTNCIAMHQDHSFYECYQSTAKVLLFARNPTVDPRMSSSIDRCVPMHWNGQPSVGCQGKQFGFIYTPYESSKIFSFLDGWLMLARFGLQVVENFKQVEEKSELVCWNEEDIGRYKKQMNETEDILKSNRKETFEWAKLQLEEMRTDLEELIKGKSISIERKIVFEEKLDALKEDLLEQIAYSSDLRFMGKNFSNIHNWHIFFQKYPKYNA